MTGLHLAGIQTSIIRGLLCPSSRKKGIIPKKEKDFEETVQNALAQIEEKRYEAVLTADGFEPGRIKKYGFAFKGKECLIAVSK